MPRTPKPDGRRRPALESRITRSPATRRDRDRLLVVCGAEVTERVYLRGLVDHVNNPAVTVRLRTKACSPAQLVAFAVDERARAREDFDQVWCVFDVDEFAVRTAVTTARKEDVRVAVSNPCFELWLLLHFRDHTAYTATYDALVPLLKRHVPRYDKARLDFTHYAGGWRDAGSRARLLADPGDEHLANPATGMWALAQEITEAR